MRKGIFFASLAFLGVLFAYSQSDDDFVVSQTSSREFILIYVNKSKISRSKARKKALQKAAEVTVDEGYRYFTIDEERVVQIASSNGNYEEQPRNYYQEKIIESDFGSNREARSKTLPSTRVYSGYKIKISCYKQKPFKKAKDACRYTRCSK